MQGERDHGGGTGKICRAEVDCSGKIRRSYLIRSNFGVASRLG